MAIRVTYSTGADAAYIYLVPIGPGESKDMDVGVDRNMNINLDYNAEGRPTSPCQQGLRNEKGPVSRAFA